MALIRLTLESTDYSLRHHCCKKKHHLIFVAVVQVFVVWHENSLLGLDHCTIKLISAISRFKSRDFDPVFRSNSEFYQEPPQRFFRNLAYLTQVSST